ncbi:MAG: hypothetical protein KIT69_07960, partial [Propionibacteriaceae bacterium]|nr:hypothetical protein [Propionibacteriaceae bacterium]
MEPEDLIPTAGATQIAWQVSPGSLLLAPGATGKLGLRAIYDDGTRVPVELPLDADPVVVGDQVTVKRSATGLSVTAGGTIGTAFVTLTGLGALPVEPATVQVAELKPGVLPITNDHLMFPLPDVPAGITLDVDNMTRWTGIGAGGIGPFGWEDVLTRFSAADGIVRYPVVLAGPAPAAGTVIVSVEGSDVMGQVVAPPGQPILTATWNGIPMALMTVQIGDLRDVFAAYSFDLDDQRVVAAGYPMRLLDAGDGLEQLEWDDDASPDWLREQQNQSAGGRGMMPELLPMETEPSGTKCKADPTAGMYARFDTTVDQPTGSAATYQFRVMDGHVQALVAPFFGVPLTNMKGSLYVQPAAKGVKVDCTVWDKSWSLPVVPKPLGLAFQPMLALYVKIAADGTVKLNRAADVDYQVNFGFGARAGFAYDFVDGLKPVWEYVPPTADGSLSWDTLASTLGLDRDGTSPVALSADVGLGAYVGMQLGIQMLADLQPLLDSISTWPVISGWLRDGISRFTDELKLTFIDTRIGIKGAAIFGNTQAVLDQGKSENQIALLGLAQGQFTTEKIDKYFGVLGMFTPRLEVKLFPDQKQGIASLYRHLEAGKETVTVDGKKIDDEVTGITVHPDEQLVIELPVVHKPDNLTSYSSIIDPPLSSAGLYRDDGALLPPDQQPFAMAAAGSTITLTHQFTKAECEGAYATQNTFIVVPYNQFVGLDSPGWGGRVGVTCTKSTLAVTQNAESAEPITEVELTDQSTKTIGVVATELRKPLEFEAESDAAWLTLEPATGSVPPAEKSGEPSGVPLTLKADCSAGGEERFGRQETTLTLSETSSPKVIDADPIKLTITVDCSESLKLLPPHLQLDYDHTEQEVTLKADVNGEQEWRFGAHSAWLKLTRDGESGALPPGTSIHSFKVAVDQAAVNCDPALGTVQGSYTIDVIAPHGSSSVDGTVAYRCHKPELTITPTAATLSTGQEQKLTVGLRYATGPATLGVSTAGDIP